MRMLRFVGGLGVAFVAADPASAGQIVQRFFQPETRDYYGRVTREAANIYRLACNGRGENGRTYFIYQYVRRAGFRVIIPPYWGSAIGGRDWGSWNEAVYAATCVTQYVPPPVQYPPPNVPNPQQYPQYPPRPVPQPVPAPTPAPAPVPQGCYFNQTTTWTSDLDVYGRSVWTLTADGRASESGLGNATGTWRISQNVLIIQYATGGGYSGTYNLTLNSACTAGEGAVTQVTPGPGTFRVRFQRSG